MLRRSEPRTTPRPAWPRIPDWTRWEIVLLVVILAAAAFLRTISIDQVPPGMQHDEVFDARFAMAIRDGTRPVFFDENAGVPPLFMYIVAAGFALFGPNLVVLRLTAALIGLAGLIVNYLLLRELFGREIALITLAGLSISFWHLFDSRVGLEPITIPLMAGLSFYTFWRGLRHGSLIGYALAGVFMGLSVYGYHSGALIPLTIGIFVLVLLIMRHPWLRGESGNIPVRRIGAGLALMFILAILVMLPLALHVLGNQSNSLERVSTLSNHLTLLFAGDPGPILSDVAGVVGMFGWRGDPEWRYNVAGRPVFDPFSALLFLAGLIICAARARRPTALFLLIWLPVNLIMAAITPPSPSSLRALGAIVPIYAMPAIALTAAWRWAAARWQTHATAALVAIVALLIASNAVWTVHDYFVVWPQHEEVRTIYRAGLAAAARYLDHVQPDGVVAISAEFAADLDQQTFDYMLRHRRSIKWFDARRALIVPAEELLQPVTYLFPFTAPIGEGGSEIMQRIDPRIEEITDSTGQASADVYHLTRNQVSQLWQQLRQEPHHRLDVNLGNEIDLLGYDLSPLVEAGQPINLSVYWKVRRGGRGIRYAFFAHVKDERGFRWTQDDRSGFPSSSWYAGDLAIQSFDLTMPVDAPPGRYQLDLGFYESGTGRRLVQIRPDGSQGPNCFQLDPFSVTPADPPPAADELDIAERVEAEFGQRIRFVGYGITERILNLEDRTEIALTWQAVKDRDNDVEIDLRLTAETGDTLPPIHRRLVDGQNPLDTWMAGQVVRDRFYLLHDPDIPRSIYDLDLAVHDVETGEYLPLTNGETWIPLGQVFMRGLPG